MNLKLKSLVCVTIRNQAFALKIFFKHLVEQWKYRPNKIERLIVSPIIIIGFFICEQELVED